MIVLNGCATVLRGKHQEITVTSTPLGAEVIVNHLPAGKTPTVVHLKRGETHTIQVELEGFPTQTKNLGPIRDNYMLLNCLAPGIGMLGLAIDLIDGAAYKFHPDVVHVNFHNDPDSQHLHFGRVEAKTDNDPDSQHLHFGQVEAKTDTAAEKTIAVSVMAVLIFIVFMSVTS